MVWYIITWNLRHGTAGALYSSLGLHGSTNPIVFCVSNPSLAVRQALKLTEKNQSFRNKVLLAAAELRSTGYPGDNGLEYFISWHIRPEPACVTHCTDNQEWKLACHVHLSLGLKVIRTQRMPTITMASRAVSQWCNILTWTIQCNAILIYLSLCFQLRSWVQNLVILSYVQRRHGGLDVCCSGIQYNTT